MQRGNGAVIGKQNTPTTSVATGVWALNEVQRAVLNGTWPASTNVDPYFENVSMLLHGNGTNGAQNNTFLDSSTNNFTITRNGNTTQGTFTPYGSNWSNYFGATGQYLSVAYSSAFNLTGDFTVECWINPGNLPSSIGPAAQSYERVFSFGTYNAANSLGLEINSNDSGNLRRFVSWYNGTSYGLGSNNAVAPGNWYHIAMVRSGTTITLYLNGTSIGTITGASAAVNTSQAFYIASLQGFEGDASAAFNGYISNFRIVKGAVYTANFTPPTSPLTVISNTSLLTCADNRFIDDSTNNSTITVNGNPSVQRFSPFNPTTPYAAGTIGGSGYFDGTGDNLTATLTSQAPGTGDFTYQFWVYQPTAAAVCLFDTRAVNNNTTGFALLINGSNQLAVYTNGTVLTGSGAITAGSWSFVTVTRSGSTLTIYLNGVSQGTTTFTNNLTDTALRLGQYVDSTGTLTGYISGFKYVKGSADSATNPVTPQTATSGTQFLASFTNGGIIDNAMMNDLETVGNAQISTSVSKFGGGSMSIPGGGANLYIPPSPNFDMGTGDFTIECWVNSTSIAANYPSFISSSTGWSTGASGHRFNNLGASNKFSFHLNGAGDPFLTSSNTYSFGVWYHYALTRSGNTWRMFIDGVQQASGTFSGSFNAALGGFRLGYAQWDGTNGYYNGYIDDLRITKGYARYTANFTPPITPFPDQ